LREHILYIIACVALPPNQMCFVCVVLISGRMWIHKARGRGMIMCFSSAGPLGVVIGIGLSEVGNQLLISMLTGLAAGTVRITTPSLKSQAPSLETKTWG